MNKQEIEKFGTCWSKENAALEFDKLSKDKNITFPKVFQEFYEIFNGYKLKDDDFHFVIKLEQKFWQHSVIEFHGLLSLEDIAWAYLSNEGVTYPEGTVPFADIELAEICISLREDSFGQIFFCDKDPLPEQVDNPSESTEEELEKFNPAKNEYSKLVFKVADSFGEFLEKVVIEQ